MLAGEGAGIHMLQPLVSDKGLISAPLRVSEPPTSVLSLALTPGSLLDRFVPTLNQFSGCIREAR